MTTWVCLNIVSKVYDYINRTKRQASVIEINHWYLDKVIHDYFGVDESNLIDLVKLQDESKHLEHTHIKATDTKGWKWGSGEIIMKKEEFEKYNWKESKEFLASDYEFELGPISDESWSNIEFKNLHEENEADESALYSIMRDYGELEDYEVWFIGPITVEIISDWNESS